MGKKNKALLILLAAALFMPAPRALAHDLVAGDAGYYTLQDGEGQLLTQVGGVIAVDDEYISADNRRYRVSLVDDGARRAVAQWVEDVTLPEVDLPAAEQAWIPRVAIYCTHSDESYVPSSGTESEDHGGDILDVAQTLADHLNDLGCEAVVDDASHVPHDAGAYRRSRKTAVSLMREAQPTLLLDVHRDGVPAEEYDKQIEGTDVTKVRIVIGRGNQNREANEEFALKVKAVADKLYPGLVKDIYLGKGSYNQDLMPRAILLEFGTHESDKERVLESTGFMAQVLGTTLGASGTEPSTPAPSPTAAGQTASPSATQARTTISAVQGQQQSGTGGGESGASWGSIAAILIVLAGIGILCLLFFSRGGKDRAGRFFRELTGMGKRDEDK